MLTLWWDIQGIVYWDLLDNNQMIISNFYCNQLCCLQTALDEKCPSFVNEKEVILHPDYSVYIVNEKTYIYRNI